MSDDIIGAVAAVFIYGMGFGAATYMTVRGEWGIALADGSVMALVRSNDEAAAVTASGRHLRVLTAAEIANVWDALPGALQVVKVEFPGARFVGGGDRGWVKDGDPIPFGDERK